MLKCHNNHSSFNAPSIVQIPKPLQKCRRYRQNSIRLKTVGYSENSHCLDTDQYKMDHYLKLKSCQVAQPEGDLSQSPTLSSSEIKQSLCFSLLVPRSINREQKRLIVSSNARLTQKAKPCLTSRSTTPLEGSITYENEILKVENQKLKHLSEVRKSQIQILLKQILELKADLSNIFNESELQQNQFHEIQRSLNIDQGGAKKQARSSIAKDIYRKLREVMCCQLQENPENKEGKMINFQYL